MTVDGTDSFWNRRGETWNSIGTVSLGHNYNLGKVWCQVMSASGEMLEVMGSAGWQHLSAFTSTLELPVSCWSSQASCRQQSLSRDMRELLTSLISVNQGYAQLVGGTCMHWELPAQPSSPTCWQPLNVWGSVFSGFQVLFIVHESPSVRSLQKTWMAEMRVVSCMGTCLCRDLAPACAWPRSLCKGRLISTADPGCGGCRVSKHCLCRQQRTLPSSAIGNRLFLEILCFFTVYFFLI